MISKRYPFALTGSLSVAGGGGGGGGGTPTQVQISGVADETIAIGDAVRFSLDGEAGSSGAGRLRKANATTQNGSEVVGIASATGNQGDAVTFVVVGSVPAKFGSNLPSTDNGKIAYLSTTSGELTLTAPSGAGQSVVRIGKVFGASGATSTPTIILNIQTPFLLG